MKYAIRQLLKSPGFTTVVVLSLALGIAATTTVFCWIQGILLNPLPGVEHQEQMAVLTTVRDQRVMYDTVSLPDLKDYQEQADVFSGVIGSQITPALLTVGDHSEWLYGQIATANFFRVLGVKPILGRMFASDEDRKPGGNPVLVLSELFWRRHLDADPAVIGRSVELNRHPFTIIGVAPAAFHGTMGGLACDFWAPISMHQEVATFGTLDNRNDRWLHVQARLRPGETIAGAQTVLDAVGERLEREYPATNRKIRLRVLTLMKAPYGVQPIFRLVLSILIAISAGVLLIVCANVACLLLARAARRQKEISIRLAIGASRGRLVRQLFVESLLLAVLGGALGAMLTRWGVDLLNAWLPPTYLPIVLSTNINPATLGFTMLITLATGVIFGFAPAWQTSKPDLNAVLKEGGRESGSSVPHHHLRNLLVVGEIALAVMVLVGAGLCLKSEYRARHSDLGFAPDHVLLAGLRIGMNGYTESTGKKFYIQLEQRLAGLPGVQAAALSSWFPLGYEGGDHHNVSVDGHEVKPGEATEVQCSTVSPNYFATMGIPLLEGRDFSSRDDEKSQGVAIINETMARRFWPGQSPIGRKFKEEGRYLTVVGIAKAGKYRSLNEPPACFYFVPYRQSPWQLDLGVCIRSTQEPGSLATLLQKEIHRVDPRVEVWVTLSMSDFIKAAYVAPMLASRVLTWLGAIALLLAAMGVYGVMAYSVSQRTNEIGLRMALGAQRMDVLRMILFGGLRLTLAGLAAGLAGAFALTKFIASLLYGTGTLDPVTFIGAGAALSLAAFAACLMPTLRAMRVDPSAALRGN